MDKSRLIEELKKRVKDQIDQASSAYDTTKSHVQADDLKSEGKYDTRQIEAGYLAGAQKRRVEELELELQMLEETQVREFSPEDEIELGSLVELELNNRIQNYYLLPNAGGEILSINNKTIVVTTAFSPIGSEIIGMKVGDEVELETPKETRVYKIVGHY